MTVVVESEPMAGLREQLLAAGVLVATGVAGLYGHGRDFVRVFESLTTRITTAGGGERAELFRFPPLIARADLLRTDFVRSFPDLIGSVHGFRGDERDHRALIAAMDHGESWTDGLVPVETMLLPAACYPLYPMASGSLPAGGRTFDVLGTCFRHEPSSDPARMQVFHQREYVHMGSEASASAFRDRWLELAAAILAELGLEARAEVANDPFFGRAGQMLAASQRDQALKYELVATVADADHPTAIVSCNCHRDHLTGPFAIETSDGTRAHSACVGFGMERITLALFAAHGADLARWPGSVRRALSE